MRWCLLWFLLMWNVAAARAADPPAAEKLRRQLRTQPADTGRVRMLSELCYTLHDQAPLRAVTYGEQAVQLARSIRDDHGLMRALLNLASCHANLSNGPQALELQQEALTIALRLQDPDGIVRGYAAMGSIHHERGDTATALRNYQQALARVREPGVRVRTQLMLFGNLGGLFFYKGQHTQGLAYTREAMMLARRSGDRAGESMYLANLGTHYLQLGRYEVAEGLLRKALTISEPLNSPRYSTSQLVLLATSLLLTQELDEAEELTRRALRQARAIGYQERVLDAYDLLANINVARNDFEQAYGWRQQYLALNDTLNSRGRLNTLTALQARYENQEKENQIRLLTQRSEQQQFRNRGLLAVVGSLALGLGGVGALFWRLRRSQKALAANHAALAAANEKTRQLAASKDRLYSIVAHDLRGPVTSFVGVTELIDFYLRTGDTEGLRRLPEQVRQSANNLNSLLNNLLNWAVSQTGELAFQPAALLVSDLFQDTLALYKTTAQARQVDLSAASTNGITVWADPNMTSTMLRNLVSNGLRFTPSGGKVHLGVALSATDAGLVTISVTDTGRGMPPEQVQAFLDPDALPMPPALGRSRSGTGLGLPLCIAFAKRQGGQLGISSTPGMGTVVQIMLPKA